VRWLRDRGYRSLSTEQVIAWAAQETPLPPRGVLLTFDDAYADLAEHAFPILRATGYSAVVYVVTGRLGEVNEWDSAVTSTMHPLLGADSIRGWAAQGIEFGAHSRTHPDLTQLTERQLRDEVLGSQSDLEALLARPVRSFAYPYGAVDEASRRVVAGAFSLAFTDADGVNRPGCDPYLIRRTNVQPLDDSLDIALRLWIGQSPKKRTRYWVGGRLEKIPGIGATLRAVSSARGR